MDAEFNCMRENLQAIWWITSSGPSQGVTWPLTRKIWVSFVLTYSLINIQPVRIPFPYGHMCFFRFLRLMGFLRRFSYMATISNQKIAGRVRLWNWPFLFFLSRLYFLWKMLTVRAIHQLSASLVTRRTLRTAATAVPRIAGMRVCSLASKNVAFRTFASSARRFGEGSGAYRRECGFKNRA